MLFRLLLLTALFGCQTKLTQIKEESANQFQKEIVLVDTRSAFEFMSYHFSGSVNLNSAEFLLLKYPKTKKRVLDPDISQIIERLARRGISPLKTIVLISEKKDSDENKKWNWLLKQLSVQDISMMSFDEYRQIHKIRLPQAPPEAMPIWDVKNTQSIFKKADHCFVSWSDENCTGPL